MNSQENEVKEVKNKKKINPYSVVLVAIGLLCIGIAVNGLYDAFSGYKEGQDIYNEAENEFVQVNPPQIEVETESEMIETETTESTVIQPEEPEYPKGPWYQFISVDLAGMQAKYDEVVGWIFFENEEISYPVMHSEVDNEKYLTTAYNGGHTNVGSIYVDAYDSGDFSDTHTLIYGHTLHDYTMFTRLKYYKTKPGYYNNHPYFQIFTGDKIYRYQVFSCQDVSIDSFVYRENFKSAKVLSDRLLENSVINPGLDISDNDKIVTLSTCTTDKQHRLIVSAVLVEIYDRTTQTLIEMNE